MCIRTCLGVRRVFNSFFWWYSFLRNFFFNYTFHCCSPLRNSCTVPTLLLSVNLMLNFFFVAGSKLYLCFYFSLRFGTSKTSETVRVKTAVYWNSELSIEEKLLFLHIYTQKHAHTRFLPILGSRDIILVHNLRLFWVVCLFLGQSHAFLNP